MHCFDLNRIAESPWKNGGGSTREIACWPPGAGMDAFDWRISVATIAQDGPFSAFPGVDRQIMLLCGDGVHLQGEGVDHRLEQRWQPFAFAGDVALNGLLLGGRSCDLNVMTRRGQCRAQVQVLAQPAEAGASPAGLCMVLQGRWLSDTLTLGPGQGLWWSRAEWPVQALRPHDGDARLVQVLLQPAA
ncbi:HutD family protein [Delftia sp. PS-11]|uniref:HutD/Ves family protein n=1 Tax=Delftia sp. PS-11 TaxID=2767222 RepID=UPI00245837C9|nr:HutD family protein [Delftia sp. PS-11]KAJ8745694.1 HutD family protein [Delftia sp. PS-11]